MTVPSGYLPSDEGVNHLQNMILAIANLQEKQRQNAVLASYRDAERLKAEQATADAQNKAREADIQQGAASLFGQKYDAAMEPALKSARDALANRSNITAPVAGATPTVGTTGTPGEIGEVKIPNVVNRPATVADVPTLARPGAEAIRQDNLAKLRSMGVSEDDPQYQYYKTSPTIVLPGQAAEELRTTAVARQERSKARVAGETEQAEITLKQEGAQKEIALRRQAEAKAKMDEANAVYAERNAFNDASIKELERQAKEWEKSQQPDKARKLREEITKLQQENVKIGNENWKFKKTVELTDAFNGTTDQVQRDKIVRTMALLNGHSGEVMANDIARQNMYINTMKDAEHLTLTGVKYLDKFPEAAQRSFKAANDMRFKAAQAAGETTMNVTGITMVPTWGGFGTPKPTYGTVVMPIDKYQDFASGRLSAAASGVTDIPTGKTRTLPDGRVVPEVMNRGEALAWHIYASNPAYATNPAALSQAIGEFRADQPTKDQALKFVQQIVMTNQEPTPSQGAKLGPPTPKGVQPYPEGFGNYVPPPATPAFSQPSGGKPGEFAAQFKPLPQPTGPYSSGKRGLQPVTHEDVQRARRDVVESAAEVERKNRELLEARRAAGIY